MGASGSSLSFQGLAFLFWVQLCAPPPTSLRLRMLPCTHVMLFAVCSHALLLLYSHWLPLQTKCPYVELGGREVRMSMCVSSTLAVVWSSAKESCLLGSIKSGRFGWCLPFVNAPWLRLLEVTGSPPAVRCRRCGPLQWRLRVDLPFLAVLSCYC